MNSTERVGSERGFGARLRRWRERRRVAALQAAGTSQAGGVAPTGRAGVGIALRALPEMLVPAAGAYITDGCSLLRIEHVHADRASGTTFVELEDCMTLELSVCTAENLGSQPLRSVVPVESPRRQPVPPGPRESVHAPCGGAAAPR